MSAHTIEEYELVADDFRSKVKIIGIDTRPEEYRLQFKDFGPGTIAIIEEVKSEVISNVKIATDDIRKKEDFKEIKEKIKEAVIEAVKNKSNLFNTYTTDYITSLIVREMLGLGDLDLFMADNAIEEIVVKNADEPIRVYHQIHGWLQSNIIPRNEEQIENWIKKIARIEGREVNVLHPMLDAYLESGDRVNAVLYPISVKGNQITIRLFKKDPITVTKLIKTNTVSADALALIWLLFQFEMSVIISGGTGTGKTSFLNACSVFFPPSQRVISIEETKELMLAEHLDWTPLLTRYPNNEGKGEVSMHTLLINTLRMRPDRIVIGEIRRKDEAEVTFDAMHTGHSVYATIHANNVNQTIRRLCNEPFSISPHYLDAVSLNVVLYRNRLQGFRRVAEVGEYIVSGKESSTVKANIVYRWNANKDTFTKTNSCVKIFDDISKHTGMSLQKIHRELEKRTNILALMVKNNITYLDDVAAVVKEYYISSQKAFDLVKKYANKKKLHQKRS